MPEEESFKKAAPKKRAPRKRVVARDSVSEREDGRVVRSRAPRQQTASATRITRSKESEAKTVLSERPTRKSPTPLSDEATFARQLKRQRIILASIVFVGVAASAGVGFTDEGTVDIEARIEARNERIRNNTPTEQDLIGGVEPITTATANSARPVEADGGMTGRGTGGRTQQRPVSTEVKTATTTVDVISDQATTTASTTEEATTGVTDSANEMVPDPLTQDISDNDSQREELPE